MSDKNPPEAELAGLDLVDFTKKLIGDLEGLRAGTISVQQARAGAELARQVIRSMHLMVTAQRLIESRALPMAGKKDDPQ